jgi:hypothetical protein
MNTSSPTALTGVARERFERLGETDGCLARTDGADGGTGTELSNDGAPEFQTVS